MKFSNISVIFQFLVIISIVSKCWTAIPSQDVAEKPRAGSMLNIHKTTVFGGYLSKTLRAKGDNCEDVSKNWVDSYTRWSLRVEGRCISVYENPNCEGTRVDIWSQTEGKREKLREYLNKVKVGSFKECPLNANFLVGDRSQIGSGVTVNQGENQNIQDQQSSSNTNGKWEDIENMAKMLSQFNSNGKSKISFRQQTQMIRRQTTTRKSYVKRSIVTLYGSPEFQGSQRFYATGKINKCANLPHYLQNKVASIDNPSECVRLYTELNCKGRSVQIQTDDSNKKNLQALDFNDKTRSFGPCEEFQKLGLELHNYYRALHGSPALRMVESLNLAAQLMAEYLVTQPALPRPIGFISAELFYAVNNGPQNKLQLVRDAVNSWYKESEFYDYNNPVSSRFTQLVWKNMQGFGMGVARLGSRSIVVANYNVRGNLAGQFQENVLPLVRRRI